MSNRTPTEPDHTPIFRELDISAEIKRIWGAQWNAPELAYEFGDRKFYLRTEDAGIYSTSPVFALPTQPLEAENGDDILQETGDTISLDII